MKTVTDQKRIEEIFARGEVVEVLPTREEFMKKLKMGYPKLTPSDLRLCAYLRMNLSSKEIAPLLGISVRGVENHRYSLRKKMDLDIDVNLSEVMMNLN